MQLPQVTFLYPMVMALVVLVIPVLWLRRKRQSALGHSQVGIHKNLRSVPLIARLPSLLLILSVALLLAALARPVIPEYHDGTKIQTIEVEIGVDISSSMTGSIPNPNPTQPPPATGNGTQTSQTYRRLDGARDAVVTFVRMRMEQCKGKDCDRIGLLLFDDQAYYHWPLTDDLRIIERKAGTIADVVGGGTNFQGPTDTDPRVGPIQAAINHFREYGKAKSKVIILVTDGEDSMTPKRQQELAAQLKEMGIKLYVLGIGWSGTTTNDLTKFTEAVGGQTFSVSDAGAMQAAFDAINKLEKSSVDPERSVTQRDVYEWPAWASVIMLALFLLSLVVTREEA